MLHRWRTEGQVRRDEPRSFGLALETVLCEQTGKHRCALQLPEEDELLWDDGSAQPERCLDEFPLVTKASTGCNSLMLRSSYHPSAR